MSTDQILRAYLAAKGTKVYPGDNVLDSLKRQLREENGMRLPVVEEATSIRLEYLPLDVPHVGNIRHWDRVTPASDMDAFDPLVVGVVVEQGGRLRLVDGYHRLKALSRLGEAGFGLFICLA